MLILNPFFKNNLIMSYFSLSKRFIKKQKYRSLYFSSFIYLLNKKSIISYEISFSTHLIIRIKLLYIFLYLCSNNFILFFIISTVFKEIISLFISSALKLYIHNII